MINVHIRIGLMRVVMTVVSLNLIV